VEHAALSILGALPGVRRLHGPGACPRGVRAQKLRKRHTWVYSATCRRLSHPLSPPLLRTHAVGYVSQTTPHARPARARSSCERTSGRARQRVLCVQRDHVARPPRAAQLRDHVRIGRSISSSEQRGTGLTFAPILMRRALAPLLFAQVASGFMAPAPVALRANAARSSRSFACLFSLLISRDVFVAPMEPCYRLAG
jgi:hypothetical protein